MDLLGQDALVPLWEVGRCRPAVSASRLVHRLGRETLVRSYFEIIENSVGGRPCGDAESAGCGYGLS